MSIMALWLQYSSYITRALVTRASWRCNSVDMSSDAGVFVVTCACALAVAVTHTNAFISPDLNFRSQWDEIFYYKCSQGAYHIQLKSRTKTERQHKIIHATHLANVLRNLERNFPWWIMATVPYLVIIDFMSKFSDTRRKWRSMRARGLLELVRANTTVRFMHTCSTLQAARRVGGGWFVRITAACTSFS